MIVHNLSFLNKVMDEMCVGVFLSFNSARVQFLPLIGSGVR